MKNILFVLLNGLSLILQAQTDFVDIVVEVPTRQDWFVFKAGGDENISIWYEGSVHSELGIISLEKKIGMGPIGERIFYYDSVMTFQQKLDELKSLWFTEELLTLYREGKLDLDSMAQRDQVGIIDSVRSIHLVKNETDTLCEGQILSIEQESNFYEQNNFLNVRFPIHPDSLPDENYRIVYDIHWHMVLEKGYSFDGYENKDGTVSTRFLSALINSSPQGASVFLIPLYRWKNYFLDNFRDHEFENEQQLFNTLNLSELKQLLQEVFGMYEVKSSKTPVTTTVMDYVYKLIAIDDEAGWKATVFRPLPDAQDNSVLVDLD